MFTWIGSKWFGINNFKDKCDILTAIHELIRNNNSRQPFALIDQSKQENCVICFWFEYLLFKGAMSEYFKSRIHCFLQSFFPMFRLIPQYNRKPN